MTRDELIADVALDFIKTNLDQEPEGTLRFCMLGLEPSLIRKIANTTLTDSRTGTSVLVRIPQVFDRNNDLSKELRSDESITHWRHCQLEDGIRAVLFAAPQEELQRNDKSVEKITKIETDTLRARYEAWMTCVGLTEMYLDESKRKHLETVLQSADTTHVARTIEIFADFVLAIANGILAKGLPLQKAIDYALPSLRLPRYAGRFDRIPDKKRTKKAEWNKIFRQLHSRVRPLLVKETERGEPISRNKLQNNFKEMVDEERLDEAEQKVVQEFLNADLSADTWSKAQKALVELDWRTISDLFEGAVKPKSVPLGEQTIQFFDDEYDDLLDEEERGLLSADFPKEPSEDLVKFFESHRQHLARDKKLSGLWERYIYRNPKTYRDFLVGLLDTIDSIRRRVRDEHLKERKLHVHIPNSRKKSFWRNKNAKIARYFAFRYYRIGDLFSENVEFNFGKLTDFYFPLADAELAKTTSGSKEARSLKFEVVIDPAGANEKLIFYWEMPVDAVATALPDDLLSVANAKGEHALLPTAEIARQSVSAKGSIQRISLSDVNTIRDVNNTNDGNLVAPNKDSGDRSGAFYSALDDLEHVLDPEAAEQIREAFRSFVASYTKSIRSWVTPEETGIASDTLVTQAHAYGYVLECLDTQANNDLAREKLWREMLRLGIANVGAGAPAAIVTPWHPMRLAEISIKARQAAKLIEQTLQANEDDIFRADLLFDQVQHELVSNYYPEICIGFDRDQPMLLAAADTEYDYTLCETPLRYTSANGDDALDVEPSVAARAFGNVGEQYLKLLPHEQSNFSMVLYNSESKALPNALASELSSKVEQENELQCVLLLTHSDPKSIRRIYEQQNVAVNDESGSVMASETAQNFLSRLRVGFLNAAEISGNGDDRTADLVALQDVVARNANLVWRRAPGKRHPDLLGHVPARWSRRRPIGLADNSTSVYLTCPSQPEVGQKYLNLVQAYLNGDNALPGDVIPAREVNFRNGDIAGVFQQTHRIGEWVVCYDELVDRRLLAKNGVKVIRHIHDRAGNRSIVVSTTSKPRLLRVLLKERLEQLDPAILSDGEDVIDRLIEQANALSGQVVMRAARYGHYASELLGIVLSMEQIRAGLGGPDLPLGWYFLDDFATWFGQSEEQIADIMAIAPRVENGHPVLKVAISEAKFVGSRGYRAQAKKSAKQLEETVARIGRALDPKHERIDREIWLHRLGDFMIDGMEPFNAARLNDWDLHKWSDEVRQDNIPIQLVGFSHVFVHDNDEYVDAGGFSEIKGMPHCTQHVFDKSRVTKSFCSIAARAGSAKEHSASEREEWGGTLVSLNTAPSDSELRPEPADDPPPQTGQPTVDQEDVTESEVHDEPAQEETPSRPDPEESEASSGKAPEVDPEAQSNDGEIPEGLVEKWASIELAGWVQNGRLCDEQDDAAMQWLDATLKTLQRALRGYEMTAELVGARLTPNAALVRFRGSDDLTVPKVEKRRQELLTSHAVDVINVLAAPMEVVIMVARPSREVLHLRDLWKQRTLPAGAPNANTSLLLGACESDGEMLYLNVGDGFGGLQPHGPHTLIAGETGSGKGVLVQCLLLDICATNAPASARIRMIDPKAGIDFPWLRRMPHLDGDLITERDIAIETLQELVGEMERRNRLLANAGVTKLFHYNQKVEAAERLPRIWVFHDELADWMMIDDYRDAVDLNASRLGVKARAAGINLVLVTQRPDKDALPMQLRANLTNRLVLKVADKRNSVLVLDEPGAERLLGRGHLAAKLSGEGKVILAQVPFASEEEIAGLAELIRRARESDSKR